MIEIIDEGRDNFVHVAREFLDSGAGRIRITGDHNRVAIARPAGCVWLSAEVGGGSELRIWPDCRLGRMELHLADRGLLEIGAGCAVNGLLTVSLHEPAAVRVGGQCLFGDRVEMIASDMHSILDAATGTRLNPPRDVVLEDRVWVGAQAVLLKGAHVGRESVVGMRAVVTGVVPANCVAAGNPARVVRRGVRWTAELLPWPA